jgi:hypothetical protein
MRSPGNPGGESRITQYTGSQRRSGSLRCGAEPTDLKVVTVPCSRLPWASGVSHRASHLDRRLRLVFPPSGRSGRLRSAGPAVPAGWTSVPATRARKLRIAAPAHRRTTVNTGGWPRCRAALVSARISYGSGVVVASRDQPSCISCTSRQAVGAGGGRWRDRHGRRSARCRMDCAGCFREESRSGFSVRSSSCWRSPRARRRHSMACTRSGRTRSGPDDSWLPSRESRPRPLLRPSLRGSPRRGRSRASRR